MKIARVMVTKNCNFNCSYCCNQWEGMFDSFKDMSKKEFIEIASGFDGINITGGEPLLLGERLIDLIKRLDNKSIRLYTNASLLNENSFLALKEAGVKKFEVGIHDWGALKVGIFFDMLKKYGKDFRLSINQEYAKTTRFLVDMADKYGAEINLWIMDECDNADTDRIMLDMND